MRVHIGSDHAGFELKNHLVQHLTAAWHDVEPRLRDRIQRAGLGTVEEPGSLGIVIGGSGNGEQIAANKVKGVRAILAWSTDTARLGREHNNANVISVGARMHTEEEAAGFVDTFLATDYSGEDRHTRRIDMLTAYESTGVLPPVS